MTTEAVPAWRNRIVGEADVPPGELVANPENWRTHPGGQAAALEGLLGEVGWVTRVIVNRRTGHLVDGHLRVERALQGGEATVPVTYVDLEPEEERLVLASLDPIGDMADRNKAAFEALVAQVQVGEGALRNLLRDLRPPMAGLEPVDTVHELPTELRVGPGELWALGDHRLACGDATDPAVVGRLLEGIAPRLLATDPPYGVELDPTWREVAGFNRFGASREPYLQKDVVPAKAGRRMRGKGATGGRIISGDTRADWSAAFELVPSIEVAYVWHADVHSPEVAAGLFRIGMELVCGIVWDKGQFTLGRSWYQWQHEVAWVARRKGVPNLWHGDRKQPTIWHAAAVAQGDLSHPATCCLHQSDVWAAPSPLKLMAGSKEARTEHPTQKPVVLSQIPIANHLAPGEWVYDPFLGSGTTLIAAETLGRRCAGLEIDPRFASLIVERWEAFTGRTAERLA